MERKIRSRVLLLVTLLTAAVLAGTVFICARMAGSEITRHSFDELTSSTKQLAKDYNSTIHTDRVLLSAMAELIAEQGTENGEDILRIINSFDLKKTFIADVELLLPDGKLLCQDGTWHDASGRVDFALETEKGAYISDRAVSFLSPELLVLRNAVPVTRDGGVIAMLYGVIPLQAASRTYSPDLYGGKAFVLIIDGTTGDILLDTWHDTLGNLADMSGRKTLKGYTYEQAVENMRCGRSGDMRSVSKTSGSILYMHYEPVGVNNWSVTVGVSEADALAGTRAGVRTLYLMTVIVGTVLLAYMAYMIWYLASARRSIYRMSITDQCTGLMNRSAYEKFLRESDGHTTAPAVCIYIDANGLHELNNKCGHEAGDKLLQSVAECLRAQFPDGGLYRVGGDEFVVFPKADAAVCEARMQAVLSELAAQGYSISYGIAAQRAAAGLGDLVREADENMLENKRSYYAEHDRRGPR